MLFTGFFAILFWVFLTLKSNLLRNSQEDEVYEVKIICRNRVNNAKGISWYSSVAYFLT